MEEIHYEASCFRGINLTPANQPATCAAARRMIINNHRLYEKGLLFFPQPFYRTNIDLYFTLMRPVPYKHRPAGFFSCLSIMCALMKNRAIQI